MKSTTTHVSGVCLGIIQTTWDHVVTRFHSYIYDNPSQPIHSAVLAYRGTNYATTRASAMTRLLYLISLPCIAAKATSVFTDKEVQKCSRFRLPQLVRNNHSGAVHVLANCCGANRCSSKAWGVELDGDEEDGLGDDFSDCKVIMKTSHDEGRTWTNFQTVSPKGADHYASGAGIYDKVRSRLVVQYQHFPYGSTKPCNSTIYLQTMSSDDGATWSKTADISPFINPGCNDNRHDGDHNKVYQSAGSKVQTPTGRLVWPGKAQGGPVCVWYSDDGGATYNVSNQFKGNEVSVAYVRAYEPNELYMNGRGQQFPWGGTHRTEYRSHDGGTTWSSGTESQLTDGSAGQVERSLRHIGAALYAAGPMKPKRSAMRIYCSRDEGHTWPSKVDVNDDRKGGYSDMVGLRSGKELLLVWEDGEGNFNAEVVDHTFCA